MDVVITETDTTVYLDGEYAGNTASSYKLGDILGEEGGILQIGKANWENGEYFNGLLDNLQIYCRAKTAEELALPDTEEAVVGLAASRLEIPGLDDIRGNISLTDQIEGAAVSWKSSDPSGHPRSFRRMILQPIFLEALPVRKEVRWMSRFILQSVRMDIITRI